MNNLLFLNTMSGRNAIPPNTWLCSGTFGLRGQIQPSPHGAGFHVPLQSMECGINSRFIISTYIDLPFMSMKELHR